MSVLKGRTPQLQIIKATCCRSSQSPLSIGPPNHPVVGTSGRFANNARKETVPFGPHCLFGTRAHVTWWTDHDVLTKTSARLFCFCTVHGAQVFFPFPSPHGCWIIFSVFFPSEHWKLSSKKKKKKFMIVLFKKKKKNPSLDFNPNNLQIPQKMWTPSSLLLFASGYCWPTINVDPILRLLWHYFTRAQL